MIRLAQRRIGLDPEGRVAFRVADAADLPYEDDSFDLVAQLNMPPFFAETARVAASGRLLRDRGDLRPSDPFLHARVRASPWLRPRRARAGRERWRRRRHLLGGAAAGLAPDHSRNLVMGKPDSTVNANRSHLARQPRFRGGRARKLLPQVEGAPAAPDRLPHDRDPEPRARGRGGAARRGCGRDSRGHERRRSDRTGRGRLADPERRQGSFLVGAATTSPGCSGSGRSRPARSRCSPRGMSARSTSAR